jgi:hypothetical protein
VTDEPDGFRGVAETVTRNQESRDVSADAVIQELRKAIEALKYGTITIKVHNGKITQMEITEKRRFGVPMDFEKGGGI